MAGGDGGYLFRARHGEEGDLGELLLVEGPVAHASGDLAVLDHAVRSVVRVEDQLGDVLTRHLGQLAREDVLQRDQLHAIGGCLVVVRRLV